MTNIIRKLRNKKTSSHNSNHGKNNGCSNDATQRKMSVGKLVSCEQLLTPLIDTGACLLARCFAGDWWLVAGVCNDNNHCSGVIGVMVLVL